MTAPATITVGGCELTIGDSWVVTLFGDGSKLRACSCYDDDSIARAAELGYGNGHEAVDRMTREHDLAHARVAEALGLPHSPMLHAVANGQAFDATEADREERLALLLQRVSNEGLSSARVGAANLAGAVAAHPAAGSAGDPSDPSAPASANTTSMGAGSAPDPDPAAVCRRGSGSRRGTPAPAPIENVLAGEGIASEPRPGVSPVNGCLPCADAPSPAEPPVAFTDGADGRREGPPAS